MEKNYYEVIGNEDEKGIDLEMFLETNGDFNSYVDNYVDNVYEWTVYANKEYFSDKRISEYRGISVIFNEFARGIKNVVVVLNKDRR